MKVGFTGTREGMTKLQRDMLEKVLIDLRATEIHHGDCLGSDFEAHCIAIRLGLRIIIHPPDNDKYRAFCIGANETRVPLPYLERNRAIVDETTLLIGASISMNQQYRGGTWSTIHYSRTKHASWAAPIVLWPDGQVTTLPKR